MKTVLVTIHGQETNGRNLEKLSHRISTEGFAKDWVFKNIRYNRLSTFMNVFGYTRKMTARYIASELDTIDSDYPSHKIIVVAHSNGSRATKQAIVRSNYIEKPYPRFRIDKLILLGSAIRRKFDWSVYPEIEVINFVSSNDKVIFFARLYGMGTSGRKGFKIRASNLKQIKVKWGHSGYLGQYKKIRDVVK